MSEKKGPIESRPWRETLDAFAVDGGFAPRVHGYDVESDLATHYRFTDVAYLAIVGELPNDAQSRGFEIVMCFLLPATVCEAPIHAAVLAGHFGAPPSGVLLTGAVTLADHATKWFAEVDEADGCASELPSELRAASVEENASVDRLRERLASVLDVPLLARGPRRDLALVAALRGCGLRTSLQVATAVTIARLPIVAAEAAPRRSDDFVEKYPMNTPPFAYEE